MSDHEINQKKEEVDFYFAPHKTNYTFAAFLEKHIYQIFLLILADRFDDNVKFIKTQVE